MTNTILNVPRELLERVLNAGWGSETVNALDDLRDFLESAPSPADHVEDARAMVAKPSPDGVDGCKCSMSIRVLGDGCRHCQPQEYIDRLGDMLDEERAELSDAQAIIDGLRGENERIRLNIAEYNEAIACYQSERDQQAQRIGELEGFLREVHDTYRAAIHWEDLRGTMKRIDAALSAGKEGE